MFVHRQYRRRLAPILVLLAVLPVLCVAEEAAPAAAPESGAPQPTGREIFQQCGHKYPGEDQQGVFTLMLRDRDGKVKKSEYLRYWRDFKGADGVSDKMLLFTTYPPEAKGSAFLRVGYSPGQDKGVDQWIYLPLLKKIRRVSIRDPGDSFLNSNLTYADIGQRPVDADEHKFIGVQTIDKTDFYVVESVPKEANPQYGKRVFWFLKSPNWDDCINTRIDYYDTNGELLKDQFIKWQKVGKAWVWEQVLVRSRRTMSASVFLMSDVKINTGLDADIFSARTLERGPEAIPGYKPKK